MPFAPERIGPEAHKRLERAFYACVGVFSVVGIAVPTAFARALEVTYFINIFIYAIVRVLELLLNFFGNLVTLFVDVVINVSMYNSFVSAAPVQAGWPLIRDVVNMLFIIVLLITAFSTIIQYKKFDYRAVLPKLLLMAVLVNFSKTLIGLLIDFSQVMMLTFVNGFKAAAAGNFVSALKLDKVLSWAKNVDLSQNVSNNNDLLVKILLAEMLGMFMLGTMVVTLLIMIVYLVGRVVGLWIALIMSPAAFFAIAIESTPLSKGLSFISGSFWPRLGALLSGGPIMAFFLWLALGTVQTGGFGNFDAGAVRSSGGSGEIIQYFSTAVGNTQEIATFLIAVMMLLMGVEAAVSISGQVSSTLGKATGKIRDVGMRATRLASYGALAGAGAFATRRVIGGGARAIDSRADVTGKIGGVLQRTGGLVPVALGGRSIQAAGGKLRTVRSEQRGKEQKAIQGAQAHMHTDEQIADLERIIKRNSGAVLGNPDTKRAAQLDLAKLEASKEGMKVVKKRFEDEAKAQAKKQNIAEGSAEEKAFIEAYSERQARMTAGARMQDIEEDAKHDADLKKLYDEETEKNPDYIKDDKAFASNLEGMASKTDARGLANRISMKAYSDPRTADWVMKNTDALKSDGTWNEDSQYYKAFVKGGGARGAIFEKRREDLAAAASDGNAKTALAGGAVGSVAPGFYVKGEGNTWNRVNQEILTRAGEGGAVTVNVNRRESEIDAARKRIRQLRENDVSGAQEPVVREAQLQGMLAGGKINEMYAVNQAGKFERNDDRANFRENTRTLTEGDKNIEAYERFDVADLEANLSQSHEARAVFAGEANVGKMAESWKWAEERQASGAPRNATAGKNIARAVQVVHDEGARVENVLEQHNLRNTDPATHVDTSRVVRAALANDAAELEAATEAFRSQGGTISMDEAKALAKKQEIDRDENLRAFRKQASSRVAHATQNARARSAPRQQSPVGGSAAAGGAAAAASAAAPARPPRPGSNPSRGRQPMADRSSPGNAPVPPAAPPMPPSRPSPLPDDDDDV